MWHRSALHRRRWQRQSRSRELDCIRLRKESASDADSLLKRNSTKAHRLRSSRNRIPCRSNAIVKSTNRISPEYFGSKGPPSVPGSSMPQDSRAWRNTTPPVTPAPVPTITLAMGRVVEAEAPTVAQVGRHPYAIRQMSQQGWCRTGERIIEQARCWLRSVASRPTRHGDGATFPVPAWPVIIQHWCWLRRFPYRNGVQRVLFTIPISI